MNTHNYVNKTLILSFLSIVHSYINITIFNTCKQIYVFVLIEIYIVTHVYKKNKAKLSTSHWTFAKVLSTKTASDCSLTSFRLLQKLSFSCPIWLNKIKSPKIIFESSFIAKNPFHAILGLQKIFLIFFRKITKFLYVSTPKLHSWIKWSQQKITFECSFIAQIPFQTILGLRKIFEIFKKFEIFICFDPYTT